jgi:hypothetical protein
MAERAGVMSGKLEMWREIPSFMPGVAEGVGMVSKPLPYRGF